MYITINVKNKIAALQDETLIINGNSDYVIKFDFDAEWDAYETKTARFVTARGYTDVVFSGDEVALPVITDAISVRVGVYAGNLHTTTPAVIFCRRSITDGSGSPVDPPDDVYNQIMERLNELGTTDPEAIAAAVADYIAANPITETDPTVPAWAKAAEKPAYTAAEVGAISQEDLQAATDAALYQAKESGLFDGKPGKDGVDGKDGQPGADGRDGLPGKDGKDGAAGPAGADGKSAYQYAQDGGYTGTEEEFTAKLAQEKFANPNALTFTGAVTGSYDGSAPLSVEIPEGGGGTGGGSSGTWELIGEVTSDGAGANTGISIPCDISGYKSVFVYAQNLPNDTNFRIVMRPQLTWSSITCYFGYNLLGKQGSFSLGTQSGKMNNPWSITGLAYNIANRIFAYGAAEAQYNGGSAMWRQGEQGNKLPTESWNNIKYISLDRNSSTDIVPEGCILRAWGCK